MDAVAAISPQRHSGYAMLIKYPSALDFHPSGGRAAVILNLSRVGGHYHAAIVPANITQAALCDLVDGQIFCPAEHIVIYIAAAREPLDPRSQVTLQHGDVITVVERGGSPPFLHLLEDLFEPDCEWGALEHIPRRILTPAVRVLHEERHFTLVGFHFPLLSVNEAISQVLGTDLATLSIATSWHFGAFDNAGAPCDRCVSFCIRPRRPVALAACAFRAVFVFCDLRPLGMHPQCLCAHSFHLHIPMIASLLGIQLPRDFTLKVEGGMKVPHLGRLPDPSRMRDLLMSLLSLTAATWIRNLIPDPGPTAAPTSPVTITLLLATIPRNASMPWLYMPGAVEQCYLCWSSASC